MQTGRAFSALYAARSIFCCAAGCGPAGVLLQKAEAVRCAARGTGGCAAGRGGPLSCCIGRRGLRGGTIVWRHAVREGVFGALRREEYRSRRGEGHAAVGWFGSMQTGRPLPPALRRAVCCVVTEPAGRCGYFSFSAYRRRQRKVPRKEARHSYFFERDSVQVHKSCRKEAGTAAFLSASQTPKGKKSRPKERPWLPQERGKHCIDEFCVRRTGAAPRAPQSGAQGAAGSEASEV